MTVSLPGCCCWLGDALEVAAAAGDAAGRRDVGALQLGDDPLDRAAGRELHDQEADRHDPDHRRDEEKQAAQDVGAHALAYPAMPIAAALSRSNHQVVSGVKA